VFIHAPTYGRADFFAMSLNSTGNGITFVDPPAAVVNSLGLSLSTAFPHRIVNEHESDDGIFTITLNSGINGALSFTFHNVFLFLSSVVVSNGPREESIYSAHSQVHQRYGI
jgi:hypothetical protein